ncbi:MAG: double-strand break repair helicase AddA [Hellea sp.]
MSNPDYIAAVTAQRQAADPFSTRLASANAGSGKTRVLVNRVSRILLGGAKPETILCLTYTKAAASEMQSRLFETLGAWSILDDAPLRRELDELVGTEKHDLSLQNARQLFAKALETPEGLKVQTIHAFCERILSRFPIEAGILPGFEPLDEAETSEIREEVRAEIYKEGARNPQGAVAAAIAILTLSKADMTLDGLFKWMTHSSEKINEWDRAGGIAPLADMFGIAPDANEAEILQGAWRDTPKAEIRQAAAAMLESPSVGDKKKAAIIFDALEADTPEAAFTAYASAFLTANKSSPLKNIITKKGPPSAVMLFGYKAEDPTPELSRILRAWEQAQAANCLTMTRAVFTVANLFASKFKRAKNRRRGLDFNDQVILVRNLLSRSEVSDWVRYKLDGGIEHILLDEAQDTAPAQWEIIDALASAFEQEERDTPQDRTLFAVGDEKQSIYSFQGAEPEQFLKKIQHYTGGDKALSPRMRMSFRSAPEILRFVDQIFVDNQVIERMFDAQDHLSVSDLARHTAHREDAGRVDLWPLTELPEAEDEKDPWDTTPVNALSKGDAREQLAVRISETIKDWIDNKEPVFDRNSGHTRPMQAGDILILVRQRNDFFDAVIRNLKSHGVAVAGADRLKLKDSIAVKDLLSLANFTLLQQDDLSLAEVLKSPLFNYSVEDLFDVSTGREGSLWAAVKERRPDTAEQLSDIIAFSRRFAPYEFFARVLDMPGKGPKGIEGISMTRQIYKRLGMESKDAIEAFLARALAHQRQSSPSLAHFVRSFAEDDQELKREMDSGTGEVRVMTVHGAKGLEAPVVFLPDTTQTPSKSGPVIKIDKGYAVPTSSKRLPPILEPYKEAAKAKRAQEYLRLLYVAMTRAESRLVLCGYKIGGRKTGMDNACWYEDMQAAFEGLETRKMILSWDAEGLTFGAAAEDVTLEDKTASKSVMPLPSWISRSAPPAPKARRQVTPSHLLAPPPHHDMPVRSPLTQTSETRFLRGNLIHKLLEVLPEFEASKRAAIAEKMLAGYKRLSEDQRDQIISEVFAVLNAPEFAEIFALGSRSEISLAGSAKGLPEHLYLNAQIDRISVTKHKVFIIDYKSNRPPPLTQDGVADIYWGQMAAYRQLAREIYPGREIVCALLWTDGPHLMILDDSRLDMALTQIASLPT